MLHSAAMSPSVRTALNRTGRVVVKLLRYSAVSGISTATSLSILGILVGLFGVDAVVANVVATAVGTVPSFELNRRWVWCDRSQRSVLRQVTPFCTLSFAGLVISTLAVRAVSAAHHRLEPRLAHARRGGRQRRGRWRAVGGGNSCCSTGSCSTTGASFRPLSGAAQRSPDDELDYREAVLTPCREAARRAARRWRPTSRDVEAQHPASRCPA